MKSYKVKDVKKVCESIYGKSVTQRTFIRWKKHLAVSLRKTHINFDELARLITYANLKRKQPYTQHKLSKVLDLKMETLDEFYQNKHQYQEYFLPNECKGDDLIGLINFTTGRNISNKSLYRIGKKLKIPYSTNKNYKKEELFSYISHFL